MAMSLERLQNKGQIHDLQPKEYCTIPENLVKIRLIDPEITGLQRPLKIKRSNRSKTYSQFSRQAEPAKIYFLII